MTTPGERKAALAWKNKIALVRRVNGVGFDIVKVVNVCKLEKGKPSEVLCQMYPLALGGGEENGPGPVVIIPRDQELMCVALASLQEVVRLVALDPTHEYYSNAGPRYELDKDSAEQLAYYNDLAKKEEELADLSDEEPLGTKLKNFKVQLDNCTKQFKTRFEPKKRK
jgi:hypothetical protein